MAPLPAVAPDVDRRWSCCGCRRIPICGSTPTTTRWTRGSSAAASRSGSAEREITAVALDTGELACRHAAVLRQASHDHRARARPRAEAAAPGAPRPRGARRRGPLAGTVYDALIA